MTKIKEPYRCNGCGKLRENDANHWWLLRECMRFVSENKELALAAWDADLAHCEDVTHACGQECAQKLIGQWMATGSFTPPSSRPVSSVEPKSSSTRKEGPDGKDDGKDDA
jgi:hypothetical protein